MWIYFYVSGKSIEALGRQLRPSLLVERTEKTALHGKTSLGFKASFSKLIALLGSTEGAGQIDAEAERTLEQKFKIPEAVVLEAVIEHLSTKETCSELTPAATVKDLADLKRLVKFKGKFKPVIVGDAPAERRSYFDAVPSLDWIGHCGEVTVLLTTSKESMITRTPIYRCLADETRSLTLEGFGVAHAAPTSSSGVELLPLVLGVNLG